MDHIDDLKRFLLKLPSDSEFNFNKNVRKQIREALFLAATDSGKYLSFMFPDVTGGGEPLIDRVDKEFEWLFANYYKSILSQRDPKFDTQYNHVFHGNLPCARIFRKGEPIYRCLTCGYDDTCALCSHCFQPENHVGHNIHIFICQRENGGVCDCGDPEAWVSEFSCPHAGNTKESPIPLELQTSLLKTLETALDFVIDIMSHSTLQFDDPEEASFNKVESNSIDSTLDPEKYACNDADFVDSSGETFYLMVYNDQIRHFRDAVQRIHLASKKVKQFAVMVTDKVQNYGKAKVIGSKNIKLLIERQKILSATGLATCIRSHRDVFREDMCDEILIWINDLTQSDLFKISNSAKYVFCRAFCGKWNSGLLMSQTYDPKYQYKVGTLDGLRIPKIPSTGTERKSQPHWYFQPSKWNLPQEVCIECDYNLNEDEYDLHTSHLGSRLQYFIYLDVRFWKSIRILLHEMYATSLITNLTYKNIISCQYVDIYPTIADMFLTMDREPELNIMSTLSTQLFTCPSNSTSIVQHGDVSRIFASIYGFLTVDEIRSPEGVEISHEISMKSLKNRRWGQIFFDVGYILSRSGDSKTILTSNIIPMTCDILALFQGRPVMKRESKNHIEYESPDYTAFFHAILVIYQFGEYIANCMSHLKDESPEVKKSLAKNAINYVINFLLKLENNDYPGLTDEFVDISLSQDKKISKELIDGFIIQDYRIDEEKVSFLHPIHSFLSWLIEFSNFESPSEIIGVLESSTESYVLGTSQALEIPNPLTSIFDYPIRTIVLMSQIKSGFWVRNGFSVRSQLQLYRSTVLRESGYMRDLFLTQVFINSSSPNLVCFLLFSRWLLMDGWIVGSDANKDIPVEEQNHDSLSYDEKTLPYMLEECMNFLIHILTEDLYLQGLKFDDINQIRMTNEIIHNLCFAPMSYSKLCSQIPDHITIEKRFDGILEQVTTSSPAKGTNDTGIYQLKEEYFEKINPYYFNYSTNTKEDAIKFVKEQIHKRTNKPLSEIVIEPKIRNPGELGIYKYIGNFSASAYFSDFLIRTLLYVYKEGVNSAESLLETALHLIHICSFEETTDMNKYGSFYDRFVNISDGFGTSIAVELYKFLVDEEFNNHHAKICSIFRTFETRYHNLTKILKDQVSDFDAMKIEVNINMDNEDAEFEKKKKKAKDRKAKLMAKFKKQQSLFLKKNNYEAVDCSDIEMEEHNESGWKFPDAHCILCQNASEDPGPFGIIAYVSKSSEFRSIPFDDRYWFLKSFSDGVNLDHEGDEDSVDSEAKTESWKSYMKKVKENNVIGPGFAHQSHVESKLISLSCGHGMHFQCYMNFLNNNRGKLNQITRNSPENVDHKEFLCPLCKSLNNMFIPILWSSNSRNFSEFLSLKGDNPFEDLDSNAVQNREWYDRFTESSDIDIEELSILTPSAKTTISSASKELGTELQHFRMLLGNMFQITSFFSFPQVFKADSTFLLFNSIKSAEIALRGTSAKHHSVISQLSGNALLNLRTLNEFRNTSVLMKIKNWIQTPNPRGDAYAKMLANIFSLSLEGINTSILEGDFFESLINILPLPSSGFSFNSILSTCLLGHIIQNLNIITKELALHDFYHSSDFSIFDTPIISGITQEMSKEATDVFRKMRSVDDLSHIKELNTINDPRFGMVFYSMLIKASTPFLRRAAIFAYVQCAEVDTMEIHKLNREVCEADRLCDLMNVKRISQYLSMFIDSTETYELKVFSGFLTYMKSGIQNNLEHLTKKTLEYPGIIKLAELPERLDFFFTNYYYLDKFNNPHISIEDPAICLFCGDVVDAQKPAIGCKEGQCTTHFQKECPNEIGIFLLPKERSILLLHKNGGSFYNAPFVYQHGELNGESKKGKTLYLMKPRYEEFIRNVWLQHKIPDFIVRNLDSVLDPGGWDTL